MYDIIVKICKKLVTDDIEEIYALMADQKHFHMLENGIIFWNQWRQQHPEIQPDLRGADLRGIDLHNIDFNNTNLTEADLSGANLNGANLLGAILVKTNMQRAFLSNCLIYGTSVWDVNVEEAIQFDLIITPPEEPIITVDNLKIAQFIYLLINNREVPNILDGLASKVVLILGRFTYERKGVLDAIREKLHQLNYVPILFDFEKPTSKDYTETILTIAHLSRFIIADLTQGLSIPQELSVIVPTVVVPIIPLLQDSSNEYAMFSEFRRYPWVLPTYIYHNPEELIMSFQENVIEPTEKRLSELRKIKGRD